MRTSRLLLATTVAAVAALAASTSAWAAGPDSRFSETTTVGTHNTYVPATFQYLAQALDQHPGLIELDVWDDVITREWKASHDNPLGNADNCVAASSAAQLYTGGTNKNLEYCLDDIRVWLAAHPGTGPLFLKLELKAGFSSRTGLGPAQLDSAIAAHLGSAVFKPADLLGGYPTLDQAARANAWPTRAQLAGKVVIEIIPGTFEEGNPTDTLLTDVEYARYLKGLAASGALSRAQIFPAVHNAQSGDPRSRYGDASLRPWFVAFDGDATRYVTGGIDTSWYDANHYLLVMTDAQNVPPAVADGDVAAAQAPGGGAGPGARERRVRGLVAHASGRRAGRHPRLSGSAPPGGGAGRSGGLCPSLSSLPGYPLRLSVVEEVAGGPTIARLRGRPGTRGGRRDRSGGCR